MTNYLNETEYNSMNMDEKSISFEIEIVDGGYKIISQATSESSNVFPFNSIQSVNGIPFKLKLQVGTTINSLLVKKYLVSHQSVASVVLGLSGSLNIVNSNKNSDILIISCSLSIRFIFCFYNCLKINIHVYFIKR